MRYSRSVRYGGFLATMLVANVIRAEDLKVIQLEQDVHDLQREVQQQSRRIDMLESELRQTHSNAVAPRNFTTRSRPSTNVSAAWLTIENWDRIRAGSTELQVLDALGPPSAVRKGESAHEVLLYTLEIAAGGFLTGQVVLDDHRVVEIQKPALK